MASADAAKLYADLLTRAIANTIYGDMPQDPWSGGAYQAGLREKGQDWPSVAHSMIGMARLNNLRSLTERALTEHVPGDFIETGVWRGGACILMRGILKAHGETGRKVIVCDSFEGLPPPNEGDYPADAGDTHYTYDQLAIPLEQVQANFRAYDLLDDQVEFHKGWFRDTLPPLKGRRLALMRLDGDMYESTMDGLVNLYDSLSPGGFCIIDDFGAIPACREAVLDFRRDRGITDPMSQVDWTGVWWRKTCPPPA
ncbi:TylF/MycF family methyltransferase [Paracoccus sp. IB05]|uniref:TylF/MycF family methyltransferase n=1 Tax=Paracoccus sp. IB05 TaxID=2779367 RepID=UPI0018E8219A|nr:TylF/MycF family methyltransferase [Paracoccus sp. IB05]MBJ2151018.1 TylF/MycF family methyltransferase [Paracoccus sp. IB05]